jgi:hypothetical protein
MDRLIPNIDWYRKVSIDLGVPTRCPFASVERCPRYYQSLSSLSSAGHTEIPPKKDKKLQKKWEKSDLWPTIGEQETLVSGAPERRKTFSNFCPEVAYDRFGFFGSELYPYHDETDQDHGINLGAQESLPSGHWVFNWSHVSKMHYTDCPLYSPLLQREGQKVKGATLVHILTDRVKNNPIAAILILIFILIVGLGSLTDSLTKIQSWISQIFASKP